MSVLVERLSQAQPARVRIAAAERLRDLKGEAALKAVDALTAGCRDPDSQVRNACVVTLGTLLNRHSRPCPLVLVEAMFDTDDVVRSNAGALVSLLEPLPKAARPLLLKRAVARDPAARADAVVALGRLGNDKTVLEVLEARTRDEHPQVRVNAVAGLWHATHDLARVVPHWVRLVEEPTTCPERGEQRQVYQQIGVTIAATNLRNFGMQQPRKTGAALVRMLTDDSPAIRAAAARHLGAIARTSPKSKSALVEGGVPASLKPLLDDPAERVRAAAAGALQEFECP